MNNKFNTVIDKNTFYFFNKNFEEEYENHISSMRDILILLSNGVKDNKPSKDIFEKMIFEKENGFKAVLALTGFSNESFKRLITMARIVNNKELSKLLNMDKWDDKKDIDKINEFSDDKINSLIKKNESFRKGIVNLFFEGSTVSFLVNTLPPFELKKLSISRLDFSLQSLLDTIVRYKEKGSYSANKNNNPERLIETILNEMGITFEKGDLPRLSEEEYLSKRTMDFIIPNKKEPKIIIESSFLSTTSSGQGDKSKTEIGIGDMIKKYYPNSKFIGFLDGIGWYVRKGDLERMVSSYDDVFTFHSDEIARFKKLLEETEL